jgi:hypothetical protein
MPQLKYQFSTPLAQGPALHGFELEAVHFDFSKRHVTGHIRLYDAQGEFLKSVEFGMSWPEGNTTMDTLERWVISRVVNNVLSDAPGTIT